jgi:hypothetical protein
VTTALFIITARLPFPIPARLRKAHHPPAAVVLCRQDIKDKAGRQAVAAVAANGCALDCAHIAAFHHCAPL